MVVEHSQSAFEGSGTGFGRVPGRTGCGVLDRIGNRFGNRALACAFVSAFVWAVMSLAAPSAALANDQAGDEKAPEKPRPPLHLIVSLTEQEISVYQGKDLIETAPISSGKQGYSTPTGVFSILEKRRRHFSNLYDDAPMPFMQRLTWSGVALHEGRLPGYPASHGCVRLPKAFAESLFGQTSRGTQVIVTGEKTLPLRINHPSLPQPLSFRTDVASLSIEDRPEAHSLRGTISEASASTEPLIRMPENPFFDEPLRMIVTPDSERERRQALQRALNDLGFNAGTVDGVIGPMTRRAIRLYQEAAEVPVTGNITDSLVERIFSEAGYDLAPNATLRVRRKFRDVYQAPVRLREPDKEIGTHVFTALDFALGDPSVEWIAVSAEGARGGSGAAVLDRLELPARVRSELDAILTPGSSLIVTDRSFQRHTDLGTDFVVITR
ncbi:hypothetical protein GCM10011316_24700 [Roseibium aquae]|uniref:L,D-TPase catalytic domain-containing protein n=1 Tax=Roseibium aquae TaxID=1323746 RepID=A0A916X2M7_9HYPH|nr:L,D-transpeptidase family protein [Roseibium aquae]GGB51755.1 hypothetical protein GCM10011316_24700 [Roseibium aquae]